MASSAGANAVGSSAKGSTSTIDRKDRERGLETSREGGPGANTPRQRADVLSPRSLGAPGYGQGSAVNPFAMMRRMMDDMDRLFSDFGFAQPGLLASSFFEPGDWLEVESPQRAFPSAPAGPGMGLQRGAPAGQPALQRGTSSARAGLWSPQVEVIDRGNTLVVRADLPGLSREDVQVEVQDDALVIRGERRSEHVDDEEGFYRSERSYGSFYRVIPLPENLDASACNATFKDGVLQVTLPKPQQQTPKSRRVEIR